MGKKVDKEAMLGLESLVFGSSDQILQIHERACRLMKILQM